MSKYVQMTTIAIHIHIIKKPIWCADDEIFMFIFNFLQSGQKLIIYGQMWTNYR